MPNWSLKMRKYSSSSFVFRLAPPGMLRSRPNSASDIVCSACCAHLANAVAYPSERRYNHAVQLQESERRLAQARWDLKAAHDSAAAGNFEWACFQAQQAAEKALKSFLYRAGAEPSTGHSVRRLVAECERISADFAGLRDAAELDGYYIPTRYPNGLPDDVPHEYYTVEAAEECLSLASSVIEFVGRLSET